MPEWPAAAKLFLRIKSDGAETGRWIAACRQLPGVAVFLLSSDFNNLADVCPLFLMCHV